MKNKYFSSIVNTDRANNYFYWGLFVLAILLLSGCANHHMPSAYADPYGFFSGLWHGAVFPFALLTNLISWFLSLIGISFLADIQIIGRPNTGFFYYAGFSVGFLFLGGGAAR